MSLLQVRGLQVAYGGIQAVRGLDLEVGRGETVALLGANGAGKSSVLRALSGLDIHGMAATATQLELDGRPLRGVPSHRRAAQGLALVPEGRGLFSRMTVEENLLLGLGLAHDPSDGRARLQAQLERFPRLAQRRSQLAGTLSGGEQQMLAIARALIARPKLLMLDEPSMGLAPILVREVFDLLHAIRAEGTAILLVEQHAREALSLADRAIVLRSGERVAEGTADDISASAALAEAYLGMAS